MEDEAREWMAQLLGREAVPTLSEGGQLGPLLRDGRLLCELMNKIQPGSIDRISTSNIAFKQMENIKFFLQACRKVGVMEYELFETPDLYDLKNIDHVVRCLHALGRAIQKNMPDFAGPKLGVKECMPNKRNFSPEKLKEGRHLPSRFSLGSSQTMERSHVSRSNDVTFGASASSSPEASPEKEVKNVTELPCLDLPASSESATSSKSAASESLSSSSSSSSSLSSSSSSSSSLFLPPAPLKAINSDQVVEMQSFAISSLSLNPLGSTFPPRNDPANLPATLASNVDYAPIKVRGGGYGMDAELARRAAEKYNVNEELQVKEWMEQVTGEKFNAEETFAFNLKNGQLLCQLVNRIKPGVVGK